MHTWAVVTAKSGASVPSEVVAQLDERAHAALTFPPSAHHRWSSTDGRMLAAGWSHVSSDALGSYWEDRGSTLTAFSGRLWRDLTSWRPGRTWAAQLADHLVHSDIDQDVERFSGMFTMVHLRVEGTGWVTADPLGTGMAYSADAPTHSVVTNRAALAASLVTPPGRRPVRDLEGMGLFAFTGTLQGEHTGFEAVRVIPQGSIVHLARGRAPRTHTWSTMPWWVDGPEVDLDTAVERSLVRLRAGVRLLASPGEQRAVCELTGGKDSRLVLALLLAEGLAHEVEFRTWGPPDLPDVLVATRLAERYGLDHRVGVGPLVDRTGRSHDRHPGHSDTSSDWSVRPMDLEEHYRHHVWVSSGGVSLWDLYAPLWPPPSGVALSGIGVEILSTNYPSTNRVDRPELLSRFVHSGGFVYDSARLLKNDVARHLRGVLARHLREARPDAGDSLDAVDGYYVREKFRRWSGAITEVGVRERMFALYDLPVLRDAFAIGSQTRRSDVFHYRLMEACAPGLARMPFSGGGWSPELARSLPDGSGLPTRSGGRTWLPAAAEIELYRARRVLHRSRNRAVVNLARRRRPGTGGTAESNRMQDLEQKRAVLRSLLDLPNGHPTWGLYERKRTLDALDRIESLPTQGRAELHHAATVATWLDGGERRADLFVPATD